MNGYQTKWEMIGKMVKREMQTRWMETRSPTDGPSQSGAATSAIVSL
jgi:hypothetical protein